MPRKLALRPDWQIALMATVALRVFFSAMAAIFSPFLHPDPALIASNALTDNLPLPHSLHYALLGIWERFDTLWYLRIAARGYDQPMAVIFYPLYPAAIRLITDLWISATVAALLVSTEAAFFAFWGLLRLGKAELSEDSGENPGIGALLAMAAWPSSFILFAGYAESLTLALIVWAVIFAREARWKLAMLCGFLAGLTRPSGVLVAIPLFVIAWRSRRLRAMVVILSPLGTLSYWGWLRWSGRLSVVDAYRIYQGATLAPPWAGLAETLRLIFGHGDAVLAVKLGVVMLAVVFSLRREMQIEDKLFAIAMVAQMMMYTGRPLLGGPRYVLPMYPAFLSMGSYFARRWHTPQFVALGCFGLMNLAWMWAFLDWSLVF